MPGADGPPVRDSLYFCSCLCLITTESGLIHHSCQCFARPELSILSSQGHPGKEGPTGTKGNQVGVKHQPFYPEYTSYQDKHVWRGYIACFICWFSFTWSSVVNLSSFVWLVQGPSGPQGTIGYPGPRGLKVSTGAEFKHEIFLCWQMFLFIFLYWECCRKQNL